MQPVTLRCPFLRHGVSCAVAHDPVAATATAIVPAARRTAAVELKGYCDDVVCDGQQQTKHQCSTAMPTPRTSCTTCGPPSHELLLPLLRPEACLLRRTPAVGTRHAERGPLKRLKDAKEGCG